MVDSTFLILVSLVCFSLGSLFAQFRQPPGKNIEPERHQARTGFLFEGDQLVDATPIGKQLLNGLEAFGSDQANLVLLCKEQYPDLQNAWDQIDHLQTSVLTDTSTGACDLEISKVGQRVSIRLLDGPDIRGQTIQEDLLASRVEFLANVINAIPSLVWQQHHNGSVLWSNQSYKDALRDVGIHDSEYGLRHQNRVLFPNLQSADQEATEPFVDTQSYEKKGQECWFNITSFPVEDGKLHVATNVNDVIRARRSQASSLRTFVQIFAQLSIGFAIFDESRQLTIYNPSVVELTNLDPVFLTAKPTLLRMIEEMRRKGKTPEPKNFEDLRETIRQIEQAAEGNTYESVWTLVDGQSLRVTARPYQTGSIALLIEDVSSELALTRRYRTEVTAYQELFELVERPTFLFSSGNVLLTNNERVTTREIGNVSAISNVNDLLDHLNALIVPGRKLSTMDINVAQSTAIGFTFRDGRSFELRTRALNGGLFCIELEHQRSKLLKTPKVIGRPIGQT